MIINTLRLKIYMTGFRLVKISEIHMIKCLLFQDERKLKDHIFLSFCLSIQLGIKIVIKD